MQIKAAVVSERSGPFAIETVELCEPRPDEVIVRVVASGMCQTDLHGRDGYFAILPYPSVYGHEGAGVVHAVGAAVHDFEPGDHVVMSFPWCGSCPNCQERRYSYCVHSRGLKMRGTRADGSTLLSKEGAAVYGAFFQQSSFGTYASDRSPRCRSGAQRRQAGHANWAPPKRSTTMPAARSWMRYVRRPRAGCGLPWKRRRCRRYYARQSSR